MKKRILTGCMMLTMMLSIGFMAMAEDMPGPDGDALWHYISKVSPYTDWDYWPDHKGMQEGRAPHAPLHKVFVNKQALESTGAPLKFGAIEVKENYSPSHELKAITVMYKIKGYNPKDGDWFWVKYSARGKTLKAGKPGGCIGCHATRVANDYVLVHEFK
ncbi:cytochrome P460 family protein [Desulfomarina sp.]